MALDYLGIVHLAGYTESSDFPVLAAAQGTLSGTRDTFITKLALFPIPPILAPLAGMAASRVRYADGIVSVGEVDIASSGFGASWGQSRTWTNAPGYATRTAGGAGSVTDSMPVLVPLVGLNSIAVLLGGTSALFFDLVSGSYVARFDVRHLLSRDVGAGEFTLIEPDGGKFVFYDFANSLPR